MPAPRSTDSYPLWLKQALTELCTNPTLLPKHIPFHAAGDRQQFQRIFYGYQKALAKEEEKEHHATGKSEFFSRQLAQLMLRKVKAGERREYPDAIEEYVILLRDDDPRTRGVQEIFTSIILEGAQNALSAESPHPVENSEAAEPRQQPTASTPPSIEGVLAKSGYSTTGAEEGLK